MKKIENISIGFLIIVSIILVLSMFSSYRTEMELCSVSNELQVTKQQLEEVEDIDEYKANMIKGFNEIHKAGKNEGYAEAYYEEASSEYADNFFILSMGNSDMCDVYYSYASQSYRDAKAYFIQAKRCTNNTNTQKLTQDYIDICEINARLESEMHQACEYFSFACYEYANGNQETGDIGIERMNEHIEIHDNLVPEQNDLWSSINAMLK